VEFNNKKLAKEEMEKTILVDIPSKIYPELRQIFVFLFENSGFKDIKINETVDFEKLYKMRKVQ
jgi:preprotein translocase subunit SecB